MIINLVSVHVVYYMGICEYVVCGVLLTVMQSALKSDALAQYNVPLV